MTANQNIIIIVAKRKSTKWVVDLKEEIIKDRITTRLNDNEKAELEYFMKTFKVDIPSEALKIGVKWVNHYIKNVTRTFFPQDYDIILYKRTKNGRLNRKVYD